jgi:hypothetical protein
MFGKMIVPHLQLVPADVGRQVIKGEMTTWEVAMLLRSMKKETTKELKDLLNPTLTWVLQASCKKTREGAGGWSLP